MASFVFGTVALVRLAALVLPSHRVELAGLASVKVPFGVRLVGGGPEPDEDSPQVSFSLRLDATKGIADWNILSRSQSTSVASLTVALHGERLPPREPAPDFGTLAVTAARDERTEVSVLADTTRLSRVEAQAMVDAMLGSLHRDEPALGAWLAAHHALLEQRASWLRGLAQRLGIDGTPRWSQPGDSLRVEGPRGLVGLSFRGDEVVPSRMEVCTLVATGTYTGRPFAVSPQAAALLGHAQGHETSFTVRYLERDDAWATTVALESAGGTSCSLDRAPTSVPPGAYQVFLVLSSEDLGTAFTSEQVTAELDDFVRLVATMKQLEAPVGAQRP